MNIKAIILAGGKGTRLKPYSVTIPKPLLPVGDKAILEIILYKLKQQNITDITICVNHMAELIKAYFGNGEKIGVNISYSLEEKDLNTIAPLKLLKNLPDNFIVLNGDLLTNIDINTMFDIHCSNNSILTMGVYKRKIKIDFGVIEIEKDIISNFKEKPELEYYVSMGIYAFNSKILNFIPDNTPFGFDHLMTKLLENKIKITPYIYDGYWLDIGRPEDYEKANIDISKEKI